MNTPKKDGGKERIVFKKFKKPSDLIAEDFRKCRKKDHLKVYPDSDWWIASILKFLDGELPWNGE